MVALAIKLGVRHIDAASLYGNEKEVGQGIADGLREAGIDRAQLWVTTKLWNDQHARVEEACKESLAKLGLNHLDAYLMHFPVSDNKGADVVPPLADTWRDMEKLVDAGLVRHIGVSNFSIPKLVKLQESAIKPISILQAEAHPMFRNDALVAFAESHNIFFTAYSSLGSRDSAGQAGVHEAGGPELLEDATVLRVAQGAGKSPAQVCLRWALQRRPNAAFLVKASSEQHLKEDLDIVSWTLSKADMAALSSLSVQRRFVSGALMVSPEGPYKSLKELWDDEE